MEGSREPRVLVAGKRFHRDVQAAYVAGLVGVELSDAAERTFVRVSGKRGRADILLIVANEPERMHLVVEIKSTWERRTAARQRALLLRHLRQMHDYLDVLVDDIGRTVDSVVPALLYPQRPSDETVDQLEAIALPKGIMVVFYDDMDWRADAP